MAKVIVLGGSGQVGRGAVMSLVHHDTFSEVVIGDVNKESAEKLIAEIGSPKLSQVTIDASDPHNMREALKEMDVVVNCVGPFYRTQKTIMQAVIEAGVDYVDVSDDVSVMGEILALDDSARTAGVTGVVGLGFSPGVTNMMAMLAVGLLDETISIDIYHAHGGEPKEGAGVIGHRFHCMTVDCPMFLDGELKMVKFFEPDGIALREKVDFLGLGEDIPVYPYPHPEQYTIPKFVKVQQVTNKGTVLPQEYYDLTMEMCRLGLASTEPLEVKGQMVVPHDFATAYLIRERDRILKQVDFGEQRGASTVSVKGKKGGQPVEYHFKAFQKGGEVGGLALSTGVPAAVGAILLQQGKIKKKGVLPPEGCIDPVDFFPLWYEVVGQVTGLEEPFENFVEVVEDGKLSRVNIPDLI